MTDTHSQVFFGQNTGLIINSPSKSVPFIFIRCIKKNHDGNWEKPSKGEGKAIKCSLEEIIMILQVLNRKSLNWTSYHSYKDNKTQISFGWEDQKATTLWINIANYSKMLNFAQSDVLRLLLTHILNEKIEHATTSTKRDKQNTYPSRNNNNNIQRSEEINQGVFKKTMDALVIDDQIIEFNELYDNEPSSQPNKITKPDQYSDQNQRKNAELTKEMSNLGGLIKGETSKALLITFSSGDEIWIPKSTIHSEFIPKKDFKQDFLIDNWILKRNKIIS